MRLPHMVLASHLRHWRFAWLAFLLSLSSFQAQADLWAWVDGQGTTHFAASQVDERYRLYYKGNDVARLDLSGGMAAGLQGGGRQAQDAQSGNALTSASTKWVMPKRFARLDASKSYQAVHKHLQAAAKAHKLDVALLKAVVAAESGFNADAVSPKGAVGLMQLMPTTAERYGVVADKAPRLGRKGQPLPVRSVQDKLTDPRTNIDAGARYLAYLIRLFKGQLDLALAAYNAGEGAVQRAGNQIPNYRETQGYVKTVLGLYAAFKPPVAVASAKSAGVVTKEAMTVAARRSGRVRVELAGAAPRSRKAVVADSAVDAVADAVPQKATDALSKSTAARDRTL
ncbi:lytic transglycosylase domain-containing protein [Ottowia sp.]|uniref:lytic transglycosylase domain-containing protein n=1 Tax=Ottowia sp. TaxID=1898956 RepID=UPI003A8BBB4D